MGYSSVGFPSTSQARKLPSGWCARQQSAPQHFRNAASTSIYLRASHDPNAPTLHQNLARCRNFSPPHETLARLIARFPFEQYSLVGSGDRNAQNFAAFRDALKADPAVRWYRLRELADGFKPFDLNSLKGLVVSGFVEESKQEIFFAGRVTAICQLDEGAGLRGKPHELTIEWETANGKKTEKVLVGDSGAFLFGRYEKSYLFVLGEPVTDEVAFQSSIDQAHFLDLFRQSFRGEFTKFDLQVITTILRLFIELPPTFGETSILTVLNGRASKSRVLLNRPEYGMIKDLKKGGRKRYPDSWIKKVRSNLEFFLLMHGLYAEEDLPGHAPDYVHSKRFHPAARLLLQHFEALAVRPDIPDEEVSVKPVAKLMEKDARRALLDRKAEVLAALSSTYQTARQAGWPQGILADFQFREHDFWQGRRSSRQASGEIVFTFGTAQPEMFTGRPKKSARFHAEVSVVFDGSSGAFKNIEVEWKVPPARS